MNLVINAVTTTKSEPVVSKPTHRATSMKIWPVVATFQLLWLYWFMTTPLPNATPVGSGTSISRGLLLFSTTPLLNPNFRWSQSLIGQAVGELSGFTSLVDRIPIVGIAMLLLAGIWGLGTLILQMLPGSGKVGWEPGERLLAALAIGTAGWGALTLVVGRLGLLQKWFWLILIFTLIMSGIWISRNLRNDTRTSETKSLLKAVAPLPSWPFVLIMLLASMLPTIDFDCIEYHLQGPREYWQSGRISYLPHNIYTNMPFGVEMLHTSAMSLAADWKTGALAGQLLIGLHPLMTAGFIQYLCRRMGAPGAGWWGALFYLTTPWTYRLAAIPYVEGPLCAAMAAWIWAAGRALDERKLFWWIIIGIFTGWGMACKYTAILPMVIPGMAVVCYAMLSERSFKPLLGVVCGGSLIFAPWMVKNVIDTGNPVYPLAWNLFGGIDWDPAMNAKWAAAHGRKPIEFQSLMNNMIDVAGRSDWQTPLFLAFAPLAFVKSKKCRKSIFILLLSTWIFISWWLFTHRLDRFWLPIQPVLAALAGLGAATFFVSKPERVWRNGFVTLSLMANWIYCSSALAGLNEWTKPLATLWKTVPNRLYPASVLVDGSLANTDKVLLVGQAAVFYWEKPILYNTVFNREGIEIIASGKSSNEIHKSLKEMGITHLFVDWSEITRYRQPGNYGFTDFVTEAFFERLLKDGVLSDPSYPGQGRILYKVRP